MISASILDTHKLDKNPKDALKQCRPSMPCEGGDPSTAVEGTQTINCDPSCQEEVSEHIVTRPHGHPVTQNLGGGQGARQKSKPPKGGKHKKGRKLMCQSTIGEDLAAVQQDHIIKTEPGDNKYRRTLQLRRHDQQASWGFTIQSYGIHHRGCDEVEFHTYVDYVEMDGPAHIAGLRAGDVILAINGESMEEAEHLALVSFIQNCGTLMRMVVLFEDCVRKVELHLRQIKLEKLLMEKLFMLRSLEQHERRILEGSRLDPRRLSMVSDSCSSLGSLMADNLSLRPELDICPSPGRPPPLSATSLSPGYEYESNTVPRTKPRTHRQMSGASVTSSSSSDTVFWRDEQVSPRGLAGMRSATEPHIPQAAAAQERLSSPQNERFPAGTGKLSTKLASPSIHENGASSSATPGVEIRIEEEETPGGSLQSPDPPSAEESGLPLKHAVRGLPVQKDKLDEHLKQRGPQENNLLNGHLNASREQLCISSISQRPNTLKLMRAASACQSRSTPNLHQIKERPPVGGLSPLSYHSPDSRTPSPRRTPSEDRLGGSAPSLSGRRSPSLSRLRSRSRLRRSFRGASFSPHCQDRKPLSLKYVVTEENSCNASQPRLLSIRWLRPTPLLYRMTLDAYEVVVRATPPSEPIPTSNGQTHGWFDPSPHPQLHSGTAGKAGGDNIASTSRDVDAALSPPTLSSGKSIDAPKSKSHQKRGRKGQRSLGEVRSQSTEYFDNSRTDKLIEMDLWNYCQGGSVSSPNGADYSNCGTWPLKHPRSPNGHKPNGAVSPNSHLSSPADNELGNSVNKNSKSAFNDAPEQSPGSITSHRNLCTDALYKSDNQGHAQDRNCHMRPVGENSAQVIQANNSPDMGNVNMSVKSDINGRDVKFYMGSEPVPVAQKMPTKPPRKSRKIKQRRLSPLVEWINERDETTAL